MPPPQLPSTGCSTPLIDLTLPPLSLFDAPAPAPSRVDGARALANDNAFWEAHQEVARLGRGCFGSVLLVRERATGHITAAKICASASNSADDECPLREPELLRAARHQHIVELLAVYQSPTTLFLMQEQACTDLMTHADAQPGGVLSEPETQRHLAGLLSAVHHIHGLRIVHRDIKATNVLLSERGEVKLADFGLAVRLPEGDALLTSVCGTHDYLAPEMIRCGHGEVEGYGAPVDLWGVGLLLYGLLIGGNPVERDTDIATLQAILAGDLSFPPDASLSADAKALVLGLLVTDPAARLTAKAAMREPWLLASL